MVVCMTMKDALNAVDCNDGCLTSFIVNGNLEGSEKRHQGNMDSVTIAKYTVSSAYFARADTVRMFANPIRTQTNANAMPHCGAPST